MSIYNPEFLNSECTKFFKKMFFRGFKVYFGKIISYTYHHFFLCFNLNQNILLCRKRNKKFGEKFGRFNSQDWLLTCAEVDKYVPKHNKIIYSFMPC